MGFTDLLTLSLNFQSRRDFVFTKEAEAKITLSVVISLPPYDIVIGLHNINMYDLNYIVKAFIK